MFLVSNQDLLHDWCFDSVALTVVHIWPVIHDFAFWSH